MRDNMVKTKSDIFVCEHRQAGCICPLENPNAHISTFCGAYLHMDSYICNASAIEFDPKDDEEIGEDVSVAAVKLIDTIDP